MITARVTYNNLNEILVLQYRDDAYNGVCIEFRINESLLSVTWLYEIPRIAISSYFRGRERRGMLVDGTYIYIHTYIHVYTYVRQIASNAQREKLTSVTMIACSAIKCTFTFRAYARMCYGA